MIKSDSVHIDDVHLLHDGISIVVVSVLLLLFNSGRFDYRLQQLRIWIPRETRAAEGGARAHATVSVVLLEFITVVLQILCNFM